MPTSSAAPTGTRIDEISDGIYRISIPVRESPGGFSFNQFLLAGDEPMRFHTGPKRMRALVQEAISSVIDVVAQTKMPGN